MYSIQGLETVFDVMAYTVTAMKESGFMPGEIEDYLHTALSENYNLHIINTSKEQLAECNKLCKSNNKWDYEDTWRDHYYSSMWDDDGRYCDEYDDQDSYSYDSFDYLTGKSKQHNIWDDDNVFNDLKDEEAYEGFNTCKNYRWDCSDNDDWKVGSKFDYYDEMKRQDDLEPSYDPFNDPDNNETMDDF